MTVQNIMDLVDTAESGEPSFVNDLKKLRDTVEQKLVLVHEGTTVHANYTMFLEELDGIIEYYQD